MPRPYSKAHVKFNSAFVCEITRTYRNVSSTTLQDSCDIRHFASKLVSSSGFQKVLFTRARVGEALGLAARSFGNISILRQVLEILGTDPRKCAEHGRNRGAGVANQIVNY